MLSVILKETKQIIDVTDQCDFSWSQEPSSCKAYFKVSDATGDFTEGEIIQGQSSGATAVVFSSYVNGNRVYIENVSGTFQEGETIQGQSSGQTATVDEIVPERSWTSTPNNITHGTFPDSVKNSDIDDYLEWESSTAGSSVIAKLTIEPPLVYEEGFYIVTPIFGVGEQIAKEYSSTQDKSVYIRVVPPYSQKTALAVSGSSSQFDKLFSLYNSFFGYLGKGQKIQLQLYHNDKYTFRWRIHHIKVLKLII